MRLGQPAHGVRHTEECRARVEAAIAENEPGRDQAHRERLEQYRARAAGAEGGAEGAAGEEDEDDF